MSELSNTLRTLAAKLTEEAGKLDPVARPIPHPQGFVPALASGGGLWPGDPAFQGSQAVGKDWLDINGNPLGPYENGDGWIIMLRQGMPDMDRNRVVREKFARGECRSVKFPDKRQEWEVGMV